MHTQAESMTAKTKNTTCRKQQQQQRQAHNVHKVAASVVGLREQRESLYVYARKPSVHRQTAPPYRSVTRFKEGNLGSTQQTVYLSHSVCVSEYLSLVCGVWCVCVVCGMCVCVCGMGTKRSSERDTSMNMVWRQKRMRGQGLLADEIFFLGGGKQTADLRRWCEARSGLTASDEGDESPRRKGPKCRTQC